jgi:hypothetical protein
MQRMKGPRMFRTLSSISVITAGLTVPATSGPVAWAVLAAAVVLGVLVLGAGGVYAYCAVRGRDPGQAGYLLLGLVQVVLLRRGPEGIPGNSVTPTSPPSASDAGDTWDAGNAGDAGRRSGSLLQQPLQGLAERDQGEVDEQDVVAERAEPQP